MAELLKEDYQNWTQTGDAWTVTSDTAATLYAVYPGSAAKSGTIYKEFTLSALPVSATLSVQSARAVDGSGNAIGTVKLTKPASLVEGSDSKTYKCIQDHIAEDTIHKPITGSDWASYWVLYDAGGGLGSDWQVGLTYQAASVVTLYSGSGNLDLQYVLDALDIAGHLKATGTYRLTLTAVVQPEKVADAEAGVEYHDLSLVTGAVWEITLDEVADTAVSLVSGMTLLELARATELFTVSKTVPLASVDEKLLVAKSDKKVYEFLDGTPDGIFDIHDEDFGMPGVDKTLGKVQFSSPAEAPHTVEVLVSIDSGLTWSSYGQYGVSKGTAGHVSTWVTAEKFCVRFKGAGLHLATYTLYGIPRGTEVPEVA